MTSPDPFLASAPSPFNITCQQCRHTNLSSLKFCEGCGAPINDDIFNLLHAPALRQARKWMGTVSLLYLVGGVITGLVNLDKDPELAVGIFIVNGALSATQGGLWWWSKRATFPAAVVSLVLYLTVILLEAISDPMNLVRGWIMKIFFVTALAKAIQAGLAVKKLQAEASTPTP